MSEKKKVSRNVAIVLGTVCILLIACLGIAMAYYTMTINGKDTTINNKEMTINQLNATITEQINTIASLDASITNLTNENNQLQAWLGGNITSYEIQISSLDGQISQLENSENSLQTTYNNYLGDHDYTNEQYQNVSNQMITLQSEYASLQSQYASLESNYASLEYNYTELMANYTSLLPPNNGISIDSVNWTGTGAINAGVTGVVVRNWGLNDTTVISLKLFWTSGGGYLASSVAVDVVIAGNSTASIQDFLPINGWNTVYDTWTLEVYTLEGYSATSGPLQLVI
jgi:uncharacterized coiled-coil protein SlyX